MGKVNIDLLFLSGLFPVESENFIIENSYGVIQNAANNLQWELARGFIDNLDKISILNSMYISSFPSNFKKMRIPTFQFYENLGLSNAINVGFLNLVLLKRLSKVQSLKPYIKKWALRDISKKKVIVAYAMTSANSQILKYVKKINSNIVTCLVVPDLPQYMNLSKNVSFIYKTLKDIEINTINRNIHYIDSYVVLTKHMLTALGVSKPSIVIEGIATNEFENIELSFNSDTSLKTILYSGGLNEKYGIVDLVSAFMRIKDYNLRLIICGAGDSEEKIINACQLDNRIIYRGLINRKEVLSLQKSSTLLVNPRSNKESYTKYSFPSKIIEYMSSGTPVLTYFLDGMPEEYKDYIFEIYSNNEEPLYHSLTKVLEMSEADLKLMGAKAKNFILINKNRKVQCSKIIKMINDV